jgi:hypothetical protein
MAAVAAHENSPLVRRTEEGKSLGTLVNCFAAAVAFLARFVWARRLPFAQGTPVVRILLARAFSSELA